MNKTTDTIWGPNPPTEAQEKAYFERSDTPTGAGPTPGPWIKHAFEGGINIADSTKNWDVCIITKRYSPPNAMAANARLIAAAPTMLQALQAAKKALADILDNHPDVWPAGGLKEAQTPERRAWRKRIEGYRDAARAAIRAAEGKG